MRLALALILLVFCTQAYSANFTVESGGANAFECDDRGVQPGDTITLAGGTHTTRLIFRDCHGTQAAPIVIRNDPAASSPAVLTGANNPASAILNLERSDWVTFDGTQGWTTMPVGATCGVDDDAGCGIQIIPASNVNAVRFLFIDDASVASARSGVITNCSGGSDPDCYPGVRGITITGVLVDGAATLPQQGGLSKAGMYCHNVVDSLKTYPGAWREDFLIEGNVWRNLWGEGLYCGNNQYECNTITGTAQAGGASTITLAASASSVDDYYVDARVQILSGTGSGQDRIITAYNGGTKVATVNSAWGTQPNSTSRYEVGEECIPNRNMVVRDNLTENTGREGINPKLWESGTNEISGNKVLDAGTRDDAAQGVCIWLGRSYANIFDNYIEGCAAEGIGINPRDGMTTAGPYSFSVYNNVIVDTGTVGTVGRQQGIRVVNGSIYDVTPTIYNNTIVDAPANGIFLDDTNDAVVRNNIVARTGINTNCSDISDGGVGSTVDDNICGNPSATAGLYFVDPSVGDYRLQAASPAVDAATVSPYATYDILGTLRSGEGVAADVGAYEYIYPEPPVLLPIRVPRGVHR